MSVSDAKVRQDGGAISAETVVADTAAFTTCSILGGTNNADVAAPRILFLQATGVATTLVSALVPGLTANGVVFVQQWSSGAAITPVVADIVASGLGFAVRLTNPANIPADYDAYVYIAKF
jgi:hypothetical protein